jgi:hypothetical protein
MKNFVIILLFAVMFIMQGCHPDRFVLNSQHHYRLLGYILGDLDSFEQINENTFKLKNGTVAIRNYMLTQGEIHFNYKMIKGDEIKFNLRAVSHQFKPDDGITIQLSPSGTIVNEKGLTKNRFDEMKLSSENEKYVKFRNVGNLIRFRHDCDEEVIETEIPATEFIFITVPEGTEVLIRGVEFDKIIRTSIEKMEEY